MPTADETYACTICRDGHWLQAHRPDGSIDYRNAVPCICQQARMEREKRQRFLAWCELPPASEHMTFEEWRPGPGLAPALEKAREVAAGRLSRLTLVSGPDRGKTHLAVAICRAWLAQDKPARFAYVPLLLDEIRNGYKDRDGADYDSRFGMFLNVPLLVLDDLGVEYSTAWAKERLDTIINYRLMHDLATVVTTNLSLKELPERIASRMVRDGGVIVTIEAPEYREGPVSQGFGPKRAR